MRPPSPGPPADRQKATSMATNGKPSVERLHQPSNLQLQDTMRRLTSSPEDRSLLAAALSCLNSASAAGGAEDLWSESQQDNDVFTTSVPLLRPGSPPLPPHGRSVSISVVPCSRVPAEGAAEPPCPTERAQKSCSAKTSRTPPPPSRKLLHLLPHIVLTRSKSQESQLVGRTEELGTHRTWKRSRLPAAGHTNGSDESGSRSPPRSARAPGPGPAAAVTPLDNATVHRSSPQAQRKDIGLAVTHRFSTKSWLSQTCEVCCRSMMFGVKCKHCKLKCHNKCTKDAPLCRISILTHPRIRRAESVPSDINNRIDHTAAISLQYGTLPSVISKRPEYSCSSNQLDCSSNPSSANSSAPSSPTRLQKSDPPSGVATPPPNPPPQEFQNSCFHFPDVPVSTQIAAAHHSGTYHEPGMLPEIIDGSQHVVPTDGEGEAEGKERSEDENAVGEKCDDEDGLEELPRYIGRRVNRWRGPITRKASQTSMYLQEWDIPYQQLQLEELIGKGRWGKVHKGRWHGEVAIRLLEIDGTNQEHLKLFKKEVMNYRQTRHENVVLFMGACLAPPHLAIVTSFCRGVTLYSMVRERGHVLDINKTRQIAQEIVKGMGYLHAKGIIHKDLKSKNVFYDTNRVVITDFGLFGMSGVVQEGSTCRRKNELRIPRGWVYYLAPEIVRKMSPLKEEDQLPFSKAADVYAFGTVWYELQVGDWPVTDQPMEAKIWLLGSGEGVKGLLAEGDLGKEVTEILSTCWSEEAGDRATFVQLADMLERLPKLNRRLSHPGHFWKSSEYAS